jgi:hypothetical protein
MQRRRPALSNSSIAVASSEHPPTGRQNHCRTHSIRCHWLIKIYVTTTYLTAFLTILAVLPVESHGYGFGGVGSTEIHHPVRRRHSSSVDTGDKTSPNSEGVALLPPGTAAQEGEVARPCPIRFKPETTQDANSTSRGTLVIPEGAIPVGSGWCRCLPTAGNDEIRCNGGGIREVPDFDAVDRVFCGLHIVRQGIQGLRQAAFGNLKV